MGGEINSTKQDNDVPKDVWEIIHEFLLGINDPKLDLREPHIKVSLATVYPLVIFVYSILALAGLVSNLAALAHILYHKLYKDETYTFLLNNCVSDIVKGAVVIPLSLYVLLVQNWVLGELLCSVLPMLQVRVSWIFLYCFFCEKSIEYFIKYAKIRRQTISIKFDFIFNKRYFSSY